MGDHGANISCTVHQIDRTGGILFSSSVSLQLDISELVVYSQGSEVLDERLAVISGIILAVIFVILIFILTALLLTRRRKKSPAYEPVTGDKGTEPLVSPIWRKGRRTKVSIVSSELEYEEHYLESHEKLIGSGARTPRYQILTAPVLNSHGREAGAWEHRPEDILDVSIESGDSSTDHSAEGGVRGNSLSRPTTRTTKTISSASDSSRSSVVTTERSLQEGREGDRKGGDTTFTLQPEILSLQHVGQGADFSSFSLSPFSPCDSDRLLSDTSENRALSRLHETHFGDSFHSIPHTVIHSNISVAELQSEEERSRRDKTLPQGSLSCQQLIPSSRGVGIGGGPHSSFVNKRLIPLGVSLPLHLMPAVQIRPGNTIFDCELGCFVTIEEYQRRRSKEKLNKEEEEGEGK